MAQQKEQKTNCDSSSCSVDYRIFDNFHLPQVLQFYPYFEDNLIILYFMVFLIF